MTIKVLRLCLALLAATAAAQTKVDPVRWTLELEPPAVAPGAKVLAKLKAVIEPGWHLYSTTTPPGPIPTKIGLVDSPGVEAAKLHQPKPEKKFDQSFNAEMEMYNNEAVFLIEADVDAEAEGVLAVTVQVRYQVCSDKTCLRPVRKTASAKLPTNPAIRAAPPSIPAGYVPGVLWTVAQKAEATAPAPPLTAIPPAQTKTGNKSWGQFLLVAFGFGLASIFTPCVFPMIPITMSYFLKREGASRRDSVLQASVFCLGIVVLFTVLGLATTAILGASGVVQLGSNVWVNAFIAAIFCVFGLSMLGAFELTLPSGMLTKLNQASENGGFMGTLLMGLTFCLTAFACVGPFVGPLLAASVQGDILQPTIGMSTFAMGLAAPFFVLALFPSFLQRMPRAGGWLPRVKIVMGFVILAVMFKYLSNIDVVTHWNLLTRERFLAAWAVLFAMPGVYLLGFLRMDGIKPDSEVGVARALTGAAFLIFALSLVPGMLGGRLGELDAFVPPPSEAQLTASAGTTGLKWTKDDYQGALARARTENKLLFVNFTGYACTNCKWMKYNMFPRPAISSALSNYVLVELYTDGTDPISEANAKLQETRFQTVAIPHYVILDASENIVAKFEGLTKNEQEFLTFLTAPQQSKTVAAR